MEAHRYWRATGLESYSAGDLELSAFHLLAAGTRIDAPATLTASVAPDVSGALASLQDADLSTAARWSTEAVKTLTLTWDFGASPADVDGIQLAGDSEARFALIVGLQWSDDGTAWTPAFAQAGIQWPGPQQLTLTVETGGFAGVALMFDGPENATVFTDKLGGVWTANGSAKITADPSKFGGSAGESAGALDGSGYISTPFREDLNMGSSDWTLDIELYKTANNAQASRLWGPNGDLYSDLSLGIDGSGTLGCYCSTNGSTWDAAFIPNAGAIPNNAKTRIRVCRSRGTLRVFVNGTMTAKVTTLGASTLLQQTAARVIGGQAGSPSRALFGYINWFVLLKGGALYPDDSSTALDVNTLFAKSAEKNRIKGRAAPASPLVLGTGPAIVYGIPTLNAPVHLSVESGAVKDQVTGVLGQGIGRVFGTVKRKTDPVNMPMARRVRLLREVDFLLIREVWSDAATGNYEFQFVDELQTYTVVAADHERIYRDVLACNLTPDLMP